jgi:hypothetical protein
MCFEMGAGTPSAGCKRAADESEAQFIFGYLLNLRVAAALLTLLGVATASAQDQIGFRIDLPIIWNKPDSENRSGSVQSGLGDLLFQAIYAHTFNDRWAAALGTRWMFPTATGDAFGDGKWQGAPIGGFRCFVPEISNGIFAEMVLSCDNSFGGNPKRSNLQ